MNIKKLIQEIILADRIDIPIQDTIELVCSSIDNEEQKQNTIKMLEGYFLGDKKLEFLNSSTMWGKDE